MNGYHIILGFGLLVLAFVVLLSSAVYAFWLRAKGRFSFTRMAVFGFISAFAIALFWGLWDLSQTTELALSWEPLVEANTITVHGYKFALIGSGMAGVIGFITSVVCWGIFRLITENGSHANQT